MNNLVPDNLPDVPSVPEVVEQARQEVERSREPWYRSSKRTMILIVIYFIVFLLFTALATFVHFHPILPIDITITREFQENQSPWLKGLMIAISYLGYTPLVFVPLIVLTALAFWLVRLRLEAILIIVQSAVSSILNFLIKIIVSRPRPSSKLVDVIVHASGQSFPSGHVMAYVAFFGLVFSLGIILFRRDRWWYYLLLIVPAFFVVMVGPSRIYLGDHWASDVLGGYLFGGLLLGIALWIYLTLKSRGILTTPLQQHRKHDSHVHHTHHSEHGEANKERRRMHSNTGN